MKPLTRNYYLLEMYRKAKEQGKIYTDPAILRELSEEKWKNPDKDLVLTEKGILPRREAVLIDERMQPFIPPMQEQLRKAGKGL